MLNIEGKTFMNIQEAVQWLLDNNCIPFQCTANYSANTEIGLGTIVNPSPAKVRIGSLIFFADSKVSTVIGITENSFICSDKYNNLVDDVAYVTGVTINASGHLITTLSDGQTIDAGIIKQVSSFSINASQHLIVTYNDGTTADLGAIFNGNISISGNLTVSGGISGNAITGDSIIENMSGYSYSQQTKTGLTFSDMYANVIKTGNKITFVVAGCATRSGEISSGDTIVGIFTIPNNVYAQLYPIGIEGVLDIRQLQLFRNHYSTPPAVNAYIDKSSTNTIRFFIMFADGVMTEGTKYAFRYEQTFLLGNNLAQ